MLLKSAYCINYCIHQYRFCRLSLLRPFSTAFNPATIMAAAPTANPAKIRVQNPVVDLDGDEMTR